MEANFATAGHDHHLELKSDLEKAEKLERIQLEVQNERLNLVMQASEDSAIAEYFLNGVGSEEALITHLQRQYDLTETEAFSAIDFGISKFGEVVDYGYEA